MRTAPRESLPPCADATASRPSHTHQPDDEHGA